MSVSTRLPVRRTQIATLCALLLLASGCSSDGGTSGADSGGVPADVGSSQDMPSVPTDAGTSGDDAQSTLDTSSDLQSGDSDANDLGGPASPGEWRLPEGYYLPAKMQMSLVFPRNDDAPGWSYAKNAHPGVRWEIPIVVQGGAWPFQYEILDDGGASGLDIGGELERTVAEGFVVHDVYDEYGVLSWDDPAAGSYEILLRVNDQDGGSIDIPISLTVGSEGWVFVDPEAGDDTNPGTHDAPLATVEQIHTGGAQFADHRVYLRGVVPMDGNRVNGNLRVARDTDAPAAWVGYPGGEAVLEAYEGKFVIDRPDFYLANLEHRHRQDYAPDDGSFLHMLTLYSNTDRYTVHDVHFSRFQGTGVNVDLGNSAIMMFTTSDGGRQHVAIVNNLMSGESGILTSTYDLRYSVLEKNRAVGADFQISDGSVWAQIYIKGGNNEFVTVRANEFWDSNQWNNGYGAIGILAARNIEIAYNTISTPYDTGRRGAIKLWTNSSLSTFDWTDATPVWLYRNSLHRRVSYEGEALANMPDGTVRLERNILDTGMLPVSSRIVATENVEGEVVLDDQMQLTPAFRAEHFGRRGSRIAAPQR